MQNKPFWIWNIEEHKKEDIKTKGECCFNHIIGLPQKDGNDKALYDYERIIFDSLVIHCGRIAINPDRFDKLIAALRTAVDNDVC